MIPESFLERIRSAHFILVATGFALLTTLFLDQNSDFDIALGQLQKIRDVEKDMSFDDLENWLDRKARAFALDYTKQNPPDAPPVVELRYGNDWVAVIKVDLSKSWYVKLSLDDQLRKGIKNLTDFRRVWDFSRRARILVISRINENSLDIDENMFSFLQQLAMYSALKGQ